MILIILLIIFLIITFPAWIVLWVMISAWISEIFAMIYSVFVFLINIFNILKEIIIFFAPYFIGTLVAITFLLVIFALAKELSLKILKRQK
ncbi:hypothetical protein [Pleurocapsa sp. FMAR1]|uniref:hypothetical protein n=1 Tax=Pleurocapsa sp. FMAR1 TaxID=3040204 RepID=UPI0029C92863|nr:hypothetical protein [Pleurocapsa sp. FMAR1]